MALKYVLNSRQQRPPSSVEKLLSGGGIKVTKGAWRAFVVSEVVHLGETW
jgi:hypothetical protein